jgi:hypothetical protein
VIQIDNAGLSDIYDAGQTVTLARQVNQVVDAVAPPRVSADASQLIVAWLAFEPLETNTIDWSEQYYCFATTTSLTMGEVLEMNSQSAAPMQLGSVYTFDQGQFAVYPSSESDYVIYNAMAGEYGFGLAQQATVNDAQLFAPICVEAVLTDEAAYFTTTDKILIFLSSASNSGTLIPPPINALTIAVGANGAVVGFNDQTHSFYQLS